MRQSGDDIRSIIFRNALVELYNNTVGELTWRLFLNRYKQNLFINKVASINNVI